MCHTQYSQCTHTVLLHAGRAQWEGRSPGDPGNVMNLIEPSPSSSSRFRVGQVCPGTDSQVFGFWRYLVTSPMQPIMGSTCPTHRCSLSSFTPFFHVLSSFLFWIFKCCFPSGTSQRHHLSRHQRADPARCNAWWESATGASCSSNQTHLLILQEKPFRLKLKHITKSLTDSPRPNTLRLIILYF